KVVKELYLPFPNVEFQPFLTEIANLRPDAVFVFFSGAGAAKFVKDYEAAGLKAGLPLYAPGFLTDGTLEAMGGAGEGVLTTLHYADGLDNAREKSFRSGYVAAYKAQPDVFAVQGYDSAQLLAAGLSGAPAGAFDKEAVMKAMSAATIDSPRGSFTLSKANNPVQDIYLRKVEGGQNKVIGVAAPKLADPARGCKLMN
ncbi:MAG TPA: ABC transporter substrate-binding protein, partial [Piscinibacter sp.]|nr:ABC transporter substrate-binding protein [Piscinibacter sp.]